MIWSRSIFVWNNKGSNASLLSHQDDISHVSTLYPCAASSVRLILFQFPCVIVASFTHFLWVISLSTIVTYAGGAFAIWWHFLCTLIICMFMRSNGMTKANGNEVCNDDKRRVSNHMNMTCLLHAKKTSKKKCKLYWINYLNVYLLWITMTRETQTQRKTL